MSGDERFGVDGKDTELDRREKRLARLQAARAQIEAEAATKARKHAQDKERRRQQRAGTGDEQAITDAGEAAAAKARPKPPLRSSRGLAEMMPRTGARVVERSAGPGCDLPTRAVPDLLELLGGQRHRIVAFPLGDG
ncbi:hypothetical protein BG418_20810 [Streptomyces sp. CBMA152]|nr:hypothetical protein [Streptomyces sp. CBMA152]